MNAYFLRMKIIHMLWSIWKTKKNIEKKIEMTLISYSKLTISSIFLYRHTELFFSFWVMLCNKHLFSLLNLEHFFVLLIILQKHDFKC